MAKLTTRDYKSTQRRAPDLRRLREFGYGMLAGIVLASTAFVYTVTACWPESCWRARRSSTSAARRARAATPPMRRGPILTVPPLPMPTAVAWARAEQIGRAHV